MGRLQGLTKQKAIGAPGGQKLELAGDLGSVEGSGAQVAVQLPQNSLQLVPAVEGGGGAGRSRGGARGVGGKAQLVDQCSRHRTPVGPRACRWTAPPSATLGPTCSAAHHRTKGPSARGICAAGVLRCCCRDQEAEHPERVRPHSLRRDARLSSPQVSGCSLKRAKSCARGTSRTPGDRADAVGH